MEKAKQVIGRILSIWTAIGSLLAVVAISGGIDLPQFLTGLFSPETAAILQETSDAVLATIGIVIAAYQNIRAQLISQTTAGVSALSSVSTRKLSLNPFSLG